MVYNRGEAKKPKVLQKVISSLSLWKGRGYKADGPTKSYKFTKYNMGKAIKLTALQKVTGS